MPPLAQMPEPTGYACMLPRRQNDRSIATGWLWQARTAPRQRERESKKSGNDQPKVQVMPAEPGTGVTAVS
jgi:hypothetical protein